ncbi:protein FAR1-RELATED SEQUENCE 7-like [Arachis stenosperma]|uniref:protein FAR1-RELATED SEQUENCE 7-like n=1 Tax=Arachis stenosperma TaxID=217475 RepID=UPI0025AD11A9|nr:protein FAR1-RELATED SEQUENCE 7-like [Arachis stenosperma]
MEEVLRSRIEGAFANEAVLDRVSERVRDVAFEEEIVQDMGMEDDEVEVGGGEQSVENGMDAAEVVTITADDFLRMEFNNPKEAAHIYEEYSRVKGFAVRQGFRDKKWLEKQDRKREHKVVTRCGCPAEMRIKPRIGTGKWFGARFVDEHNHDLLPQKFVEYLTAHRRISDVDIAHMDSLRQVGISIPKIYESIAAQAEGFNCNGVVNAALRLLEVASRRDEKMYWRYKVGVGQHMCDLFWSDGCSQEDFKLFGDVLAFDATYGRNKYNLPVVVFSEVNNHNQTCVFATAMVSSETQSSYVSVLRKFLECMDGRAPKAIITDGDRSMRVAIQEVFPDAHHRLCAWHLLKNATSNVCMPRFTSLFRHCMLADIEVEEFELQWEAMLTYVEGYLLALGRLPDANHCMRSLGGLWRADNKDELEFRSSYGTPVIQTEFPELEKSGAINFTREIFARYRESLKRCVRVTVLGCIKSEGTCTYVTQKYRRPERRWNVTHHGMPDTFVCTCLRMESFGLPCVHILAVLVRLDIGSLSKSLVLQRWSKAAKVEMSGVNQVDDTEALYRNPVGTFLQHCKRFARVACQSEENFKVYTEKVVEDTLRLEMMNGDAGDGAGSHHAAQGVRDPIGVRTKGTGRANEPVGSRAVKRRKCSTCGCLGHRRTRCPNGPRVTTSYTEQNTVPSQHMPNRDPTVSYAGNESNKRRRSVG